MESADYILAMTSICDTDEGWMRLTASLAELDGELASAADPGKKSHDTDSPTRQISVRQNKGSQARIHKSLYEAMNCPYDRVRLENSVGRTAAEYAFVYPPGIPFLVPGEEITEEVLGQIQRAKEKRLNLMGLEDESGNYIRVCGQRS